MRRLFIAAGCALAFAASTTSADAYYPYGAIASSANFAYGYAGDQVSELRADAVALVNCRARTHFACAVRVWWGGAGVCGALARNGGRQGWGFGRGSARARLNALHGAGGGYILVTACN